MVKLVGRAQYMTLILITFFPMCMCIQPSIEVFYNIGKVKADGGHTAQGELAYREAIR